MREWSGGRSMIGGVVASGADRVREWGVISSGGKG